MKYRKKPVVIDAFRLNSIGLVEEDWFWNAVSEGIINTYCFGKYEPEDAYCDIETLEGTMRANTGDYIIRGVNGEIYPCKSDIFDKTYEIVDKVERRRINMETKEKCPICEYEFEYCQCCFGGAWHPDRSKRTSVVADHIYLLTDKQIEHLKKIQKLWSISYDDDEKNQILKDLESEE